MSPEEGTIQSWWNFENSRYWSWLFKERIVWTPWKWRWSQVSRNHESLDYYTILFNANCCLLKTSDGPCLSRSWSQKKFPTSTSIHSTSPRSGLDLNTPCRKSVSWPSTETLKITIVMSNRLLSHLALWFQVLNCLLTLCFNGELSS